MTEQEQILYTYIIRTLHKHSKYSRFVDLYSPQNKFLTAEEILTILKSDAQSEPALLKYLNQHPTLSPNDLDQFLITVLDKEYPKEINPAYFHCNEENSEGKKIIEYHELNKPFQYALPKKKDISALKTYESNDFLILLGIVLTKTTEGSFTISDLKKTIENLAGEHTPSIQTITRIAKKLCTDENVKKLGFCIEYNDIEKRARKNEELYFSVFKIFEPFEASMLADMLKTYPYYSAEFANKLIEKLQFFDENGIYSFSTNKEHTLYHGTPNIPTLIDTSIRGSFRLEQKECDQFLCHINQLKEILKNKHKAIMTYGQRILDPEKERGQILTVREKTVIHPHELVWANGYYYFVATPEDEHGICEKHAHNYRVDRIIHLEELEERSKPIWDEKQDFSNGQGANFSPVAYRGTHNMMMRGDIYNIKLKCKKPLLSHVLDCFGTNTKIKKLHGKDKDWFEASFRSTLGGVAYGVTQYMDECIVLEPEELRNMVFQNIARGLSNYKEAGLLSKSLEKYL